jgi:hypothetical protein
LNDFKIAGGEDDKNGQKNKPRSQILPGEIMAKEERRQEEKQEREKKSTVVVADKRHVFCKIFGLGPYESHPSGGEKQKKAQSKEGKPAQVQAEGMFNNGITGRFEEYADIER